MKLTFQERLELNSALIAIFDEKFTDKDVETVVKNCSGLKYNIGQLNIHLKGGGGSHKFSGHAVGSGNHEIDTPKENLPFKIGSEKFRIGDFKIIKRRKSLLLEHFWESDTTTKVDTDSSLLYEIEYKRNTFVPVFLAKIGTRDLFLIDNSWLLFYFATQHRLILWGDKKRNGSYIGRSVKIQTRTWQGNAIIMSIIFVTIFTCMLLIFYILGIH